MIRRVTFVVLICLTALGFVACKPKKPAKKPGEDDTSKAFADLDKNDKDSFGGGGGDAGAAPPSDGPEAPKGPVYPAPFTAEQIRAATKNGRSYRYKIEMPNKPTKEYMLTFRNVDDGGAEIHSGGDASKRVSWTALQKQSEFSKEKTQTREEKLKTPAGKFECKVYEVSMDEGEVWTFYFAKQLPGAPVFFYSERNGKRLRTTTLVEHIPGK